MIVLLDTQTGELLQRWNSVPDRVPCPGTRSFHTRVNVPEFLPDGLDRYYLTEATVNDAVFDPDTERLGPEQIKIDGLSVTITRAAVSLDVGERRALIDSRLGESDRLMARVAEDAMEAFDNLVEDLVAVGVLTRSQGNATKAKVPASVRTKIDSRRNMRGSKP